MRIGTDIQGWYTEDQGEYLAALAARVPGIVVEIGTNGGRSISWVLARTDKNVVCVDSWLAVHVLEGFKELLNENGWTDRVEIIHDTSENAAQNWNKPIGLLHIDGNHSYEDVLFDFTAWSPYVVPGGAIVFHDLQQNGPSRVIAEQVKPFPDQWTEYHEVYGENDVDGQFSARRAE